MKRHFVKMKILLRQNISAFGLLVFWFIINYFIFLGLTNINYLESLQYLFYFGELQTHPYGYFYPTISEFLIFGLILTLITLELYRKYHPKQTCLELSQQASHHAIIIGYSHLGQQIRKYLIENSKPCVVLDKNEVNLQELIQAEEPVVFRKYLNSEVLADVNAKDANLVFCTENDLETLIIATNLVRDVNKNCKIVCRCFDDSLGLVLEKKLECIIISTSKYAAEVILAEIDKIKVDDIIIIGCTNTTRRLLPALKARDMTYKIIEKNREVVEDLLDEEPILIGNAKDKDVLKEAKLPAANLVIILVDTIEEVLLIADTVREINTKCHLICRFYHEEIAEILEKPPFNALVLSTSKHTVERLIQDGIFAEL
ncbi:MAG: hypothetical protein EU536_03535 [Promethearchaeota archaeon]|nr:MAG: hypothetical protein EU536_03535 [Candidatus Lokiarchaeota archaeon]